MIEQMCGTCKEYGPVVSVDQDVSGHCKRLHTSVGYDHGSWCPFWIARRDPIASSNLPLPSEVYFSAGEKWGARANSTGVLLHAPTYGWNEGASWIKDPEALALALRAALAAHKEMAERGRGGR